MEKELALLKSEWSRTVLIFISSLVLYISFYYIFQMSTYLTLNGVWKALNYTDYREGIRTLEPGNVLYYTVIDLFRKLFQANTIKEYYVLLIFINAFVASLLNVSLYLFARFLVQDRKKSLLWMLVHALNPGVFYLAVSSEDIYPAYACFVWMAMAFYYYNKEYKNYYLIVTSVFLGAAFLMHWTVGVPALIALTLLLTWQNRVDLKQLILKNTLVLSTLSVLFFLTSLFLSYPFLSIWYPGKSMDTMWVSGLSFYKIWVLFLNTIFYYFSSYRIGLFSFDFFKVCFILLVALFLFFSKRSFLALKRKINEDQKLKYLLVWLGLVFVFGSGMNMVEQVSDPQFFIQVQFLILFILLFVTNKLRLKHFIVFLLFDVLIVVANVNRDEKNKKAIEIVSNQLNFQKGLILADGFNPFISWSKVEWNRSKHISYYDFPSASRSDAVMSDTKYLNKTQDSINYFLDNGYTLVVVGFLNQSPETMGTKFLGYDLTEKMRLTQMYLKNNFYIDTIDKNIHNPIFILTPKANE